MKIIKGDLIELALQKQFDVIAHGVNCFCTQKSGIAKQMVEHFKTNNTIDFYMESLNKKRDIKKLGNIQACQYSLSYDKPRSLGEWETKLIEPNDSLYVINCYTQYNFGYDANITYLDYLALSLCMKKINHLFKGKKVGLPWIGCGLAGGNKEKVKEILKNTLTDVNLTIVEFENKNK